METTQVTLTFDSADEADLFLAKFLYCGGEQATGFCVIKDKSDWENEKRLLHLANQIDIKN